MGPLMETVLTLSTAFLPKFCARGCEQTLTPIMHGRFFRNIKGNLCYDGNSQKKYKTSIRCFDYLPPAFLKCGIGEPVEVGCIVPLFQETHTHITRLLKPPVDGSLSLKACASTQQTNQRLPFRLEHDVLTIDSTHERHWIISYRPQLSMRFLGYTLKTHEWDNKTSWELELEEI